MTNPSKELKPCPFCGGKAGIDNDVGSNDDYYCEFIVCSDCGVQTSTRRRITDVEIDSWNRRTTDGK